MISEIFEFVVGASAVDSRSSLRHGEQPSVPKELIPIFPVQGDAKCGLVWVKVFGSEEALKRRLHSYEGRNDFDCLIVLVDNVLFHFVNSCDARRIQVREAMLSTTKPRRRKIIARQGL